MAHTRKYLLENHRFGITCLCPVSRNMMISLQYDSEEESALVYMKIRNAVDNAQRKILLLIEMEKTPYEIKRNEGFVTPLRDFWFGEN